MRLAEIKVCARGSEKHSGLNTKIGTESACNPFGWPWYGAHPRRDERDVGISISALRRIVLRRLEHKLHRVSRSDCDCSGAKREALLVNSDHRGQSKLSETSERNDLQEEGF